MVLNHFRNLRTMKDSFSFVVVIADGDGGVIIIVVVDVVLDKIKRSQQQVIKAQMKLKTKSYQVDQANLMLTLAGIIHVAMWSKIGI